MRGVRWLAVEICIKGLREGDSFSFFGGGLSMLVSFRAAKMQTNTGNVPFSRVIGFTRNETIFIASYVPSPCILSAIVSRKWRSFRPFPVQISHTRILYESCCQLNRIRGPRIIHEGRYLATVSSHFVALVVPRKRGSLGGIHDGV